jgi:tetratricopeptide (TPR) repeat protein
MRHIEKDQKRTIVMMSATALVILLAFAHMASWGRHSVSIVFLKAAAFTGLASANDYTKLAEACTDTGRYECATDAYLYLYQETRDVEVVGQLAEFYVKMQDHKAAAATFVKYYQLEGKNPKRSYFYGVALEKLGENERAINAYKLSIEQNPEMLNLNATKSLVKLLMAEQRQPEAYDVIAKWHAGAENAKGHLTEELKLLAKYQPKRTRALAAVRNPSNVVKF